MNKKKQHMNFLIECMKDGMGPHNPCGPCDDSSPDDGMMSEPMHQGDPESQVRRPVIPQNKINKKELLMNLLKLFSNENPPTHDEVKEFAASQGMEEDAVEDIMCNIFFKLLNSPAFKVKLAILDLFRKSDTPPKEKDLDMLASSLGVDEDELENEFFGLLHDKVKKIVDSVQQDIPSGPEDVSR